MPKIKIIKATSGANTTERLLELLPNYPKGITIGKLSKLLNRPVSMLNICLKTLISSNLVDVRLSENRMQQLYYLKNKDSVGENMSRHVR